MLYSRSLLIIYFKYSNVNVLIPTFEFIPLHLSLLVTKFFKPFLIAKQTNQSARKAENYVRFFSPWLFVQKKRKMSFSFFESSSKNKMEPLL